ncbi:hypothetical protein D1818_06065 [Aquimarina sp. BL5]|uniref:hypothetical protein n=1 Tax=Aquimarina sp. BL5 TaxID=1714860 RepID=UPI000E4B4E7D|nr:hypothetical protein [Aquimarina sp. BL5]AXT50414.1 hypothetical protein D1818_06065 [Aquimarina sp. BL5]RKN01844.1 hypothetical protein D7036_17215 [Aquimarina sp. BL5]
MIENITFLHNNWIPYISISAIVVWLVFVWKESPHFGKRKFWMNITVALFAIVSLSIIALQPALPILGKNTKVALLTNGYDTKQLDSLKKAHKRIQTFPYKANQPIFENIQTSDTVFVLGEGVAPFDFWQLENYEVHYIKSDVPSGVVRFTYDQSSVVGEQLEFEGLYNNPTKGNRLILEGPGGNSLDSITLVSDTASAFQVSTELKATGNYVFSLVEKDSLGTIRSRSPIPVKVKDRTHLKILIVNGFPTFETKYLKNYLAEMGHEVLVKSRITKGKYKFEYFNTDRIPIGALSEKNLAPFDLVMLDATTAKNVGQPSRTALENAIREDGLGLFIQPDDDFFRSRKSITAFDFSREKSTETSLINSPKITIGKYPFLFKDQFQLQAIPKNGSEQIVSAYKHLGKGKVSTTVLESTYELLLNGKTKEYQQLWSEIIGAIGKKESAEVSWDEHSILGIKDQSYEFTLRTAIPEPEVKTEEEYRIAPRSDIDISNLWTGTTYPKKLGWNRLSIAQDTTAVFDYFVTDITTWKSKSAYENRQRNLRQFDRPTEKTTEQISPLEPINPIGFYIFFLLCMGYLWLAPKLGNE